MAVRAAPPAGSLRFAISGVAPGGSNWANVFWINTTVAVPTTAQMNTAAEDIYTAWNTYLGAYLPGNWSITLAKATYYGESDLVIVGEYDPATTGGDDDSVMPDQVTAVISWIVDTTWRGGKPRTYFVGFGTTATLADNAHLGATRQGEIQSAATAFLDAINGLDSGPFLAMTLGTLRFFSKGVPLDPPVFLPYSGCKVPSRICTIRRRLGRELT